MLQFMSFIAPEVAKLLGSVLKVQATSTQELRDKLTPYTTFPMNASAQPHSWPLIRKVTISCKADILRTGITLVDLPDPFKAPPPLVKNWLQNASHIWIVLAIDSRMAIGGTLVGEHCKFQESIFVNLGNQQRPRTSNYAIR